MTARTIEPPLRLLGGLAEASVCEPEPFLGWYAKARAKERFVYAVARHLPTRASAPVLVQLDAIYDEGWLIFTREKLPDGRFRYFAIKRAHRLRPGPARRFVPRGLAGGVGQ